MVRTGAPAVSTAVSAMVSSPAGWMVMCRVLALVACSWMPLQEKGSRTVVASGSRPRV
jgi:hypothetical protein